MVKKVRNKIACILAVVLLGTLILPSHALASEVEPERVTDENKIDVTFDEENVDETIEKKGVAEEV